MQFFVHCNFFCQKYNFTYLLTKQLLPIKWLIISFLIWDSIKLVGFVKLCALCTFVPLYLTGLIFAPSYAIKSTIGQCFTKSQQHICNVLWRHQRLNIIFSICIFYNFRQKILLLHGSRNDSFLTYIKQRVFCAFNSPCEK